MAASSWCWILVKIGEMSNFTLVVLVWYFSCDFYLFCEFIYVDFVNDRQIYYPCSDTTANYQMSSGVGALAIECCYYDQRHRSAHGSSDCIFIKSLCLLVNYRKAIHCGYLFYPMSNLCLSKFSTNSMLFLIRRSWSGDLVQREFEL